MILAINIGNTYIQAGCIDADKTYFLERFSTDTGKTALEYAINFKNVLEIYHIEPANIEGGIIASVVPPLSAIIKEALERVLKKEVKIVGPGLKTGLNIRIDNPAQLGSNLVADAVAAINAYPAPMILIDMGTATSLSVIDKNKHYIGGAIYPGVQVAIDSLALRTSQLPKIGLQAPDHIIGKNTVECMESGAVIGAACMLDGMIDRMEDELGEEVTIVATGGVARFIIPECTHSIHYDSDLTLKGLLKIYEKNNLPKKKGHSNDTCN